MNKPPGPIKPDKNAPVASPVVYLVDKKCPTCHKEWKGKAFGPNPTELPRAQVCDECLDAEEAAFRARVNMRNESEAAPEPEINRPKRVGK